MKQHNIPFFLLASFFLLFSIIVPEGCEYNTGIIEPPVIDIDTTVQISFSKEIIPLFDQSCNSRVCHGTGGVPPDLTAANAYKELIEGNYIDIDVPENSELYQWMIGNRSLDMPLTGPDPVLNAKVLTWIKQGAKDN